MAIVTLVLIVILIYDYAIELSFCIMYSFDLTVCYHTRHDFSQTLNNCLPQAVKRTR